MRIVITNQNPQPFYDSRICMELDSHPSIFEALFDSILLDIFLCLSLFWRLLKKESKQKFETKVVCTGFKKKKSSTPFEIILSSRIREGVITQMNHIGYNCDLQLEFHYSLGGQRHVRSAFKKIQQKMLWITYFHS